MAETQTKFDPAKTFIGARLLKDSNEVGSPIIDENTGEWVGGRVLIELFDGKTGERIAGHEEKVTRNKYLAWKEDFDVQSKEDVISQYFPDVQTTEASKTDLQVEAERSAKETSEREKDARIAELEAEVARRNEAEDAYVGAYDNVVPVGQPEETPSNPEQKISAEEAKKIADSGKEVVNPEQSAPNVPEDEFSTKGGNATTATKSNDVERNVTPVGGEAKTLKDVAQADTAVKNGEVVETKREVPEQDGDVSGKPKAGKTVKK